MAKILPPDYDLFTVMYHYVRPVAQSRFPRLKALEVDKFRDQLIFIMKNFKVVDIDFVVSLIKSGEKPQKNLALLTFDDGFSDHYNYVFPILADLGLTGAFYPCADAVMNRSLLDVHKIQFILEACEDIDRLVLSCQDLELKFGDNSAKRKFIGDTVIDGTNGGATYVKRLLQRDLPLEIRKEFVNDLFAKMITKDDSDFADRLYLNLDQISEMRQAGMHFGAHGHSHNWLANLSDSDQSEEIDRSIEMLSALGVEVFAGWTMAYPFGNHNDFTLDLLKRRGCSLAFLDKGGCTTLSESNRYSLERIDTIHLPFE